MVKYINSTERKRYEIKSQAHRIGEGKYEYRGWIIQFNDAEKSWERAWLEIDPNGNCSTSAKTLNEAKFDIDNAIEFYEEHPEHRPY